MTSLTKRIPRHILISIGGLLLAALLAASLTLITFSPFAARASAASFQQTMGTTCAQSPSQQLCNQRDPELQGCTADAITIAQADIVENGVIIGRVERRFSQRCQSWWGRVFDMRFASRTNMFITIAGTTFSASPTFVNNSYRILYSHMIFDATPTQQVPEIIGSLEIDGIAPPASTIIPAITRPVTTSTVPVTSTSTAIPSPLIPGTHAPRN